MVQICVRVCSPACVHELHLKQLLGGPIEADVAEQCTDCGTLILPVAHWITKAPAAMQPSTAASQLM